MKKILLLSAAVLLLSACSSTSPYVTDSSMEMSDAITYQSEYGFSLEFPKSWEGYTAEDKEISWGGDEDYAFSSPTVYFMTKEGMDLFALGIFTPKQWEDLNAHEEGPKPEKIGENDEYVFGWSGPMDSGGIEDYVDQLSTVRASFKAL